MKLKNNFMIIIKNLKNIDLKTLFLSTTILLLIYQLLNQIKVEILCTNLSDVFRKL